jgi:NADH-quinone oxidoreductase subunit J
VSLEAAGFWGLTIVLVVSSLLTVLSKNLFHSVLYLALALVTTAGVFLSLNAEFLFGVQIFLYAGGVVTLVVFAIMLTERLVGERVSQMNRGVGVGSLVSVALFLATAWALIRTGLPSRRADLSGDLTSAIGSELVTRYVLPLELLAVLFLAALLGALYFARRDE